MLEGRDNESVKTHLREVTLTVIVIAEGLDMPEGRDSKSAKSHQQEFTNLHSPPPPSPSFTITPEGRDIESTKTCQLEVTLTP